MFGTTHLTESTTNKWKPKITIDGKVV